MRKTLAVAVFLLASCASDGRTLQAPAPGASAPPLPPSSVPSGTAAPLTLTSAAFDNGGAIPVHYTCDGSGTSPPFAWGSVPQGTVELVLTVTDPDANGFVHWVVAGLDATVQAIPEGTVPNGVVQAQNSAGTVGWTGPCPPKGAPHHYVFNLYALTQHPAVTPGMNAQDAIKAIDATPGVLATITGTYQRV